MATGDITITNNNTRTFLSAKLWESGLVAAVFDKSLKTSVAGVYTITVGGTWLKDDVITVFNKKLVLDANKTTAEVATLISDTLTTEHPVLYTITTNGSVLTITEKSAYVSLGLPDVTITSDNGILTNTVITKPVSDCAVTLKNSGKFKFKFWCSEQYAVLSARDGADVLGTGSDDGNKIIIPNPSSEEIKFYYLALANLEGIDVTVA